MHYLDIVEELRQGNDVECRPSGSSMTPLIRNLERIVISPLTRRPEKGDIVLAKVLGRFYVHKVTAVRGDQYQISNNHGHINGWTRQVFGIVTKIG